MSYYIAIDSGTSNTRVTLMNLQGEIIDTIKDEIGVRNSAIDGNNRKLKNSVKNCLKSIMDKNNITYKDVNKIVASGMITSNVGLYELNHIMQPVGLNEICNGVKDILISEVSEMPISFIPGIKNRDGAITVDDFEAMDIMRGEEVEALAVVSQLDAGNNYMLVLPGSHTKFVSINKEGAITGCLTTMTGELLDVLSKNTILANAVKCKFADVNTYDKQTMLLGYKTAKKCGLARAAFSGRILNLFVLSEHEKIANYLLGVVLQGDIMAVENSEALNNINKETTAVIAGKEPLRQALIDCFEYEGIFKNVMTLKENIQNNLSAKGAFAVAKNIENNAQSGVK